MEMQVVAQVHHPPDTDSNDGRLTDDATSHINKSNLASEGGLSSQNRAARSDTASHNRDGNLDLDQINITGYQSTASVSHEAFEMQVLAEVHHPHDTDKTDDTDNVHDDELSVHEDVD